MLRFFAVVGRREREMNLPTHRERQVMQRLRGGAWIKAFTLANSPKTIQNLLAKGWIEGRGTAGELAYRLTDKGLEAKRAPVQICPKKASATL
ncbi:hypothetical protein CQ10_39700 [Bradyrhizobium valentinum]|nr:hypothetical protein CQ10_39700 [Bradyrhizobium valentinum]